MLIIRSNNAIIIITIKNDGVLFVFADSKNDSSRNEYNVFIQQYFKDLREAK